MKRSILPWAIIVLLTMTGVVVGTQNYKAIQLGGGITDPDGGTYLDHQGNGTFTGVLSASTVTAGGVSVANKVTGPGTATDNALVRFDGTTGKLVQNSTGILSDAGALSGVTMNANVLTAGTVDPTLLGSGASISTKYLRGDSTWQTVGGISALTGDVTASGTGSVAATIADGAVTEAKQTLADNTTNNVSITKHGYTPKAPDDAQKYLDGTGAWSVPANTDGTTGSYTDLSINGGYGGPANGIDIGGASGNISAEGTVRGDVGVYSGKSGSAGSFAVFPSVALSGWLGLSSGNHTGNFGVYIDAPSHTLAGNRTYSLTDVGANADFVMSEGTQTINGAKTFTNIALGTPASGVATNLTGTASGLTAGHVTTNANLTGDVTSVGNAATIPNDTITYAKMQNVSATDKVLGRVSVGSGDVEEISTTGSGNVVRATSPTLVTPALGTPSALVGTNITGTATSFTASNVTTNANLTGGVTSVGNAATVVTNANLTGPITSVGNATSIASQTGTGSTFAMSAGPTFTGNPIAPTQAAGTNNTRIASTAYVRNAMPNPYVDIFNAGGSLTAAKVAGTYALTYGDPVAVGGTGTLAPIASLYLDPADYPSPDGMTVKLRIKGQLYTNDVAPTGNFTYGLYPITRPSPTTGGAGLDIFTIGAVVSGSNGATYTTPAADGLLAAWSSDFDVPTAGHYIIAVVTTGTIATSAHVHLHAQLQYHYV